MEHFVGYMRSADGVVINVEFAAPIGASQEIKDAAFLAALSQQVEINYLAVGTADNV